MPIAAIARRALVSYDTHGLTLKFSEVKHLNS